MAGNGTYNARMVELEEEIEELRERLEKLEKWIFGNIKITQDQNEVKITLKDK